MIISDRRCNFNSDLLHPGVDLVTLYNYENTVVCILKLLNLDLHRSDKFNMFTSMYGYVQVCTVYAQLYLVLCIYIYTSV